MTALTERRMEEGDPKAYSRRPNAGPTTIVSGRVLTDPLATLAAYEEHLRADDQELALDALEETRERLSEAAVSSGLSTYEHWLDDRGRFWEVVARVD